MSNWAAFIVGFNGTLLFTLGVVAKPLNDIGVGIVTTFILAGLAMIWAALIFRSKK